MCELAYLHKLRRILEEFVKLPVTFLSQYIFVVDIWFKSRPWQKILIGTNTTQ